MEEKDAQPTERTAALWGLLSKIDSRIWVDFTRNGLRLGSRHQEPPHTDVSRNLATVVVRGVLPGLRRRITGLLPSGPKSSFQMRASFVFNLETKVLESGGRVEKLIAQVAWSCVGFIFLIKVSENAVPRVFAPFTGGWRSTMGVAESNSSPDYDFTWDTHLQIWRGSQSSSGELRKPSSMHTTIAIVTVWNNTLK